MQQSQQQQLQHKNNKIDKKGHNYQTGPRESEDPVERREAEGREETKVDLVPEAAHLSGQENCWGVGDGGGGRFLISSSYHIWDFRAKYLRER